MKLHLKQHMHTLKYIGLFLSNKMNILKKLTHTKNLQVFELYRKVKKSREANKKRPLFLEIFLGFTKQCFLVSTVLVKPLLHTYTIYAIYFFIVGGPSGMLLNCHMCQLFIAVNLSFRNTLI